MKKCLLGLFLTIFIILSFISYQSHAAVNAMHMKEIVAEHRQKWIEYHEARELKRQIDNADLWGKPNDVLSLTIYKPDVYERAMKLHEEELRQELEAEKSK